MPGGNVGPGVAVDLATHFAEVGTPDPEIPCVRAEVGATLARVNEVCRPFGLHFPVDPSSGTRCGSTASPEEERMGTTMVIDRSSPSFVRTSREAFLIRRVKTKTTMNSSEAPAIATATGTPSSINATNERTRISIVCARGQATGASKASGRSRLE